MSSSSRVKSASVLLLLSAAASASAVAPPTTIALSGGTAPGSGGGTFTAFTNPVLNASGQVAFQASVGGGTSTSGVFTGNDPASVQAVALQGTAAPNGGSFGTLFTASTTTSLTLNSSGTLAFQSPLTSGTSTSGVFAGASAASLQTVALQGTAAPSGGNYNAFAATGINAATSPALNGTQVAFSSTLTGGANTAGIFEGPVGSLQTVALLGAAAPGGGTYGTALTAPVVNSSGQVSFLSLLNGTSYALFAGAPGAVQLVALQGNNAPGGIGKYGTISTYDINNGGQVSFQASVTAGTTTSGIFLNTSGTTAAVATVGGSAYGTGAGTFSALSSETLNGAGQVAFTGTIAGGTSTSGLFLATASSTEAVALVGNSAPDGETYTSFASTLLSNANGDVAFLANVAGGGTEELVAGTPGNLVELVKEGDTVDGMTVSGFGLLVNSGGQDGKGDDLNDSDEVTYRLTFTNGTSGVFESAAPEPTSLILGMVITGAAMLSRRRKLSAQ